MSAPDAEDLEIATAPILEEPDWRAESAEYRGFRRFVSLTRQCRELEKRVKGLKQELEDLSYQLRDYLGSHGYQSVSVEGCTIFLRRDIFVRARDGCRAEEICDVLKHCGLGHFVKEQYSVMALSAHVRELEKMHEKATGEKLVSADSLLPPDLVALLNCDPKYTVVAREKS